MLNFILIFVFTALAQKETLVIIGDSWARLAGDTLEKYCDGREVLNFGISGATAKQFAAQKDCDTDVGYDSHCCTGDGRTCNLVDHINNIDRTKYNPTQAWLSIGGNDYQDFGCDSSTIPQMKRDIKNIIGQIKSTGIDDVIMTGYSILPKPVKGCDAEMLFDQIKKAAVTAGARYVDIHDKFGSEDYNVPANWKYFKDSRHLNALGYCILWTEPKIQESLHCPADLGHKCGKESRPYTTTAKPITPDTTTTRPPTDTPEDDDDEIVTTPTSIGGNDNAADDVLEDDDMVSGNVGMPLEFLILFGVAGGIVSLAILACVIKHCHKKRQDAKVNTNYYQVLLEVEG